jgi:hypothetical protein
MSPTGAVKKVVNVPEIQRFHDLAKLSVASSILQKPKLKRFLNHYGEYPAEFR